MSSFLITRYQQRCFVYRELFTVDLGGAIVHGIQRASLFSMPLGNNYFQQQIEQALDPKLGYQKRGRPFIDKS